MNKITKDDQKHQDALDENIKTGEQTISGTNADLESDDDTLKTAQDAGLYEDQDEEHPGELNIAEEVKKDEKEHMEED